MGDGVFVRSDGGYISVATLTEKKDKNAKKIVENEAIDQAAEYCNKYSKIAWSVDFDRERDITSSSEPVTRRYCEGNKYPLEFNIANKKSKGRIPPYDPNFGGYTSSNKCWDQIVGQTTVWTARLIFQCRSPEEL